MAKISDVNVGEKFRAITKTAGKYPLESYAVVVCAVQLEWIFLQHVKKDTGYVFVAVENILQETFLPCPFFGKSKYLPPIVGILSMIPVKNPV